jgi:hypothetical protein
MHTGRVIALSLMLAGLAMAGCSDHTPLATAPAAAVQPEFALRACCRDSLFTTVRAFDPSATIAADGRLLELSGPMECGPAGERGQFRVTVTQASGATGEGLFAVSCTTQPQQWQATAQARGRQRFAAGEAQACAELTPAFRQAPGREHWCVGITLVR